MAASLAQAGADIDLILDADGEPDERVGDAELRADLGRLQRLLPLDLRCSRFARPRQTSSCLPTTAGWPVEMPRGA